MRQAVMKSKPQPRFTELAVETLDGAFLARYSDKGLSGLTFPSGTKARRRRDENTSAAPLHIRDWHRKTKVALRMALAGRQPKQLPPLDLSSSTDFQKRVWGALRKIASGQTRSYGDIASRIGKPNAVRAVGSACGANPIPLFVPCHRVIAANGKLGGFSAGLHWKRKLLAREKHRA